jgi:hypothetical protein
MKRVLLWAGMVWLAAGFVQAADSSSGTARTSESDMFGSSSDGSAVKADKTTADTTAIASQLAPTGNSKEETLQIGGTLSSEVDAYIQSGVPLTQNVTSNPNVLFLYLDSKLENDNRVFGKIRAFYDPTGVSSGNATSASYTNPYGFGNASSDNLAVNLQELRVSANIGHQVFFNIGRQKVKYGAAKFFNPTDFLNPQPFNFFLPTDERTGVDMIKMQVPSGASNFYAAGVVGNPTTGSVPGGYFRGELPYSQIANIIGAGEISLSGWLPKNQSGRFGYDISQQVDDFDIYVEGAATQTPSAWQDATSAGFTWTGRYADRETNTISLNGEYFQAGAAAEYGILAINLGGPGGLNDINFIVTNLMDLIGNSGLSRLDIVCAFTDRITGRVYGAAPWGSASGTFYLPGQIAQSGARLDVNF